MSFYKKIVFKILTKFDPEAIHYFAMGCFRFGYNLQIIGKLIAKNYSFPAQEVEAFGLKFKNVVGLAAGFDKNAKWIDELAALGFGFIEIGTVTPKPQEGNPKPRLFRLKSDKALINRMGFNNDGIEEVVKNLKKRTSDIIVGGNIGKNKNTPNEEALNDYLLAFHGLFDYVDYFVVNVSSPNTPGLRDLQEKEPLTKILLALQKENSSKLKSKPILLKIAPDLSNPQLDDIVEIVAKTNIAGVIATNTTLSREGLVALKTEVENIGAGGLSGMPLRNRATEVVKYLYDKSHGKIQIIGVGGINTAEDAKEKIKAGAKLIQVYSGFIYEGPSIAKNILRNY